MNTHTDIPGKVRNASLLLLCSASYALFLSSWLSSVAPAVLGAVDVYLFGILLIVIPVQAPHRGGPDLGEAPETRQGFIPWLPLLLMLLVLLLLRSLVCLLLCLVPGP